ncbi:MAG TPA: rhodanese-like domain-containing protein [Steroidobacteraceae bacterium]
MPPESSRTSLAALLDAAAAKVERLTPQQALAASQQDALVVDIRADLDRQRYGIVPGSLHIPRTVLEWRFDPQGHWRSPHIGGTDQRLVLICEDGCSSLLAAAVLVDLGYRRAGDVIGGFVAWRHETLPVATAPEPHRRGELAGMRPPDA